MIILYNTSLLNLSNITTLYSDIYNDIDIDVSNNTNTTNTDDEEIKFGALAIVLIKR